MNIGWQIMSPTDAPANKTTVKIRYRVDLVRATMKLQMALFVANKSRRGRSRAPR